LYISQEHIVKKCIFVTFPLNPAALKSYKVRTNILTVSIKTGIYHAVQKYCARTYREHIAHLQQECRTQNLSFFRRTF